MIRPNSTGLVAACLSMFALLALMSCGDQGSEPTTGGEQSAAAEYSQVPEGLCSELGLAGLVGSVSEGEVTSDTEEELESGVRCSLRLSSDDRWSGIMVDIALELDERPFSAQMAEIPAVTGFDETTNQTVSGWWSAGNQTIGVLESEPVGAEVLFVRTVVVDGNLRVNTSTSNPGVSSSAERRATEELGPRILKKLPAILSTD